MRQDLMVWRWDQGRRAYFNFDSVQRIAQVLLAYNGANMALADPALRKDLEDAAKLPFTPTDYTIKRNYKRVFECSLLATYIGNRLIVSDLCRAIAQCNSRINNPDAYLYEVERRFRYPFPAFNNYNSFKGICFPFFAIVKTLLARAINSRENTGTLNLQEIGSLLIANSVTGLEDIRFYERLRPKDFNFESRTSNDQKRQVREMMSFLGQHSYISYNASELTLTGLGTEECRHSFMAMTPIMTNILSTNPIDDFLTLTRCSKDSKATIRGESEDATSIEEFSVKEGKKVFTSHLRTERDTSLRREYIRLHPKPECDVCGRNMHIVYPWTENMLEIHHLLPLSSFGKEHKTSLKDVVGVCPSCHRAIHLYYGKYLKQHHKQDFGSPAEAIAAYTDAKSKVKHE